MVPRPHRSRRRGPSRRAGTRMIPLVAVLTAFLSGSLLGIALAEIRTRRRQDEERAQRVADALADTVLVDGVELPKPEDERWARKTYQIDSEDKKGEKIETVEIGLVAVSDEKAIYVDKLSIPRTAASKAYAASVWTNYRNRAVRKSTQR